MERRRWKRYGVKDGVIRYRKGGILSFLNPPSPRYLIINISEGGVCFITRDSLAPGHRISFSITAPKLAVPIHGRAKVIWSKKSKELDAYRVGVMFTRLSRRARTQLKNLLDSTVLDSISITTKVYLREIEKL